VIAQVADSESWPEAAIAIAIAGIAMVVAIAVVVIIQIFATACARMSVQREAAYRKLGGGRGPKTAHQLERAVAELAELRARTGELETDDQRSRVVEATCSG
jgi:hypothetical protein